MTRFLHITDLHITAPETNDPTQQTDTPATLDRLIAIAKTLTPAPDFIIASGDLTNTGDDASYRLLADKMSALTCPVVYTLGNHDRRAGFHAAFSGFPQAPEGSPDHDIVHAGVHVIALDSSVPGKVSGALDLVQFDFLEKALRRHRDLPKVITLHHPPKVNQDDDHIWASLNQADTARLQQILDGHNILALLSGHVHFNQVSQWNGIPVVVTNGQQSSVDLTRSKGLAVIHGTGFAICDLLPSGLQVTFVPLSEPDVIKEIPEERLRSFS